jgi:hypothetical protein
MVSIHEQTITHFNKQIEQISADSKGMETLVSLVTFNHDVTVDFFNESIGKIAPLDVLSYKPNGSTAMFDAVATIIDRPEKEVSDIKDENVAVLIVTLSDGQENASQKYTSSALAEKIQRLQSTNRWTFAYLGANQDLSKIQQLNIPAACGS